jgi:hypothetical protein
MKPQLNYFCAPQKCTCFYGQLRFEGAFFAFMFFEISHLQKELAERQFHQNKD